MAGDLRFLERVAYDKGIFRVKPVFFQVDGQPFLLIHFLDERGVVLLIAGYV